MAFGVNKVSLIGQAGDAPKQFNNKSGGSIASLSLATSRGWRDKATQEKKEITEWHKVVLYESLADIAIKYVKKGSKVYIEGYLKTRKWADKQGVEHYTTEVIAENIILLSDKERDSTQVKNESTSNTELPYDDGIPF